MLAPNMATMLAVLTTDAEVEPAALQASLPAAVAGSFNRIVVDGCTSTNDTVIVLASGAAGPRRRPDALRRRPRRGRACRLATPDGARRRGRTPRSSASRSRARPADAEADRGGPQARREPAGEVLAGTGRTRTGAGCCRELGTAGVALDPDTRRPSPTTASSCRRGWRRPAHDAAAVAEPCAEFTSIVPTSASATARRGVLTNDLTHAYVDENMGTS